MKKLVKKKPPLQIPKKSTVIKKTPRSKKRKRKTSKKIKSKQISKAKSGKKPNRRKSKKKNNRYANRKVKGYKMGPRSDWEDAFKQARKNLKLEGFHRCKKGSAFYEEVVRIFQSIPK